MNTIGIDIGTSGVKAVLIDETGKVLADATVPLSEPRRPHPGWSEQDPHDWWTATLAALDLIAAHHGSEMAEVHGIGLSGQMHGAVLLDASNTVLRPAILWNDGRSAAECTELEAACPDLPAIAGNRAMPGFTAPKLRWIRKHEPETFAGLARVLLPKAYIRLCLTGEYAEDMSDASGTLWLDVARRDWSDTLLAATGLSRANMPRLIEGTEISGDLRAELRERWNIGRRVVVAGGGGDNAAAACGIGAIRPGEGFLSLGTSGVLFVSTDRFRPNTSQAVHAFCHAVPDTWHQMGVILSATDSLNWLARLTGQEPAALTQMAEARFTEPGEEIFLPYLSGERTPHNNALARGSFSGLSQSSDPARLAQAVMEGVAFAFADCADALSAAGTNIGRLVAVGGGARSALWLRLIATVLDREIAVPADGDYGGALGAARLGLCAATGAAPAEVMAPPPIARVVTPDAALRPAYLHQLSRYRALYPAIEEARK